MKSYEMIENLQEKLNNTPVTSINMNLYRELVFGLEDVQKQMISEKEQIIKSLEEATRIVIDDEGIGLEIIPKREAIEIVKRGGK